MAEAPAAAGHGRLLTSTWCTLARLILDISDKLTQASAASSASTRPLASIAVERLAEPACRLDRTSRAPWHLRRIAEDVIAATKHQRATEETAIQCGAAFVTLVVLISLAVNAKIASFIDVIVSEYAFLSGKSFKTSTQQLR